MRTHPKVNFILRLIVASVTLFATWSLLSAAYTTVILFTANSVRRLAGSGVSTASSEQYSYLFIPAAAIILAAAGVGWRDKAKYACLSVGLLALIDFMSHLLGLAGLASGSDTYFATVLLSLAAALPLLAVPLALGGDTTRLWSRFAQTVDGLKHCPICGKAKIGLADHMRTVHGIEDTAGVR